MNSQANNEGRGNSTQGLLSDGAGSHGAEPAEEVRNQASHSGWPKAWLLLDVTLLAISAFLWLGTGRAIKKNTVSGGVADIPALVGYPVGAIAFFVMIAARGRVVLADQGRSMRCLFMWLTLLAPLMFLLGGLKMKPDLRPGGPDKSDENFILVGIFGLIGAVESLYMCYQLHWRQPAPLGAPAAAPDRPIGLSFAGMFSRLWPGRELSEEARERREEPRPRNP